MRNINELVVGIAPYVVETRLEENERYSCYNQSAVAEVESLKVEIDCMVPLSMYHYSLFDHAK